MIFVTGPMFAGKKDAVRALLGITEEELRERAVWDVQELVRRASPEELLKELSEKEIVIATEVGGGVVPMDPEERRAREDAGRLACLLAAEADTVIRVCCGLPQLLKGALPIKKQ